MNYELVLAEKPKQALRIAYALSTNKPKAKRFGRAVYYETKFNNKKIIIAPAVGHLFGLKQKEPNKLGYPVFDIEWRPIFEIDNKAVFSKPYYYMLKKLASAASEFTVSCDYDVEGELIGYNVLRFICNTTKAARMKFSTLTKLDILKAYMNKQPSIELSLAKAGETRHVLDWYYGINLSRALMRAIKSAGQFKILSTGRVQGPALKLVVDREREIQAFKPEPFWLIDFVGEFKSSRIIARHEKGRFFERAKAEGVYKKCLNKDGVVAEVKKKKYEQLPLVPFDLTTLQVEAHRLFRFSPQATLNLAQNLYLTGLISYPRTSSQKLPPQIGYKKVITAISKQAKYGELCKKLLMTDQLKPRQGIAEDPAHPAIFPTGVVPEKITKEEEKLYELIIRRFLACFASAAVRQKTIVKLDVAGELFVSEAHWTLNQGWLEFYAPFIKLDEKRLPELAKGDIVKQKKLLLKEDRTEPPKRYTQASLVKELTKKNLGTKATRGLIVDTLFRRGYVRGSQIKPTELGLQIVAVLEKSIPRILDEEMTRKFEEKMELIRQGKLDESEVLEEAKRVLTELLEEFKQNEGAIGNQLRDANVEAKKASSFGKCPICHEGELVIKRSKQNRRFIACTNYPSCKAAFPLPQKGTIYKVKEKCKLCGYPKIRIYNPERKKSVVLCINSECPSNMSENEGKLCPKCGKGKLVVRTSHFGRFLACSEYPNCDYTEKL